MPSETAAQITPPSFRPNIKRQGGFALTGGGGLATPSGAEELSVRLSGIQIKGALPALAAATAELERRLVGRSVSGAEIFAAARDLEAAYAKAGYCWCAWFRIPIGRLDLLSKQGLIPDLTRVIDGKIHRTHLRKYDGPE